MFRDEEAGGYSKPARPRRRTLWTLILLLILAGLALTHVTGLMKPLLRSVQGDSRNLRTPASRLVGQWESNDDPMFKRICHLPPEEPYDGLGIYMADAGSGMSEVTYKLESEDRSGTNLVMAEYLPGVDHNYRVRYSVAKNGRSMTREYEDRNGRHVSCRYRYVGPPIESLPKTSEDTTPHSRPT